jgi:hypothetical protein
MTPAQTISLLRYDINNIETEWSAPTEFPDLRNSKAIAVDLETRDPNLMSQGPRMGNQ